MPTLFIFKNYYLKISSYYLTSLLFIITKLFKQFFFLAHCVLFLSSQLTIPPIPVGLDSHLSIRFAPVKTTEGAAQPTSCFSVLLWSDTWGAYKTGDNSFSWHFPPPPYLFATLNHTRLVSFLSSYLFIWPFHLSSLCFFLCFYCTN